MVVKIGLCDALDPQNAKHLVVYDDSKSIKENIKDICKQISKAPGCYGIKIKNKYVTSENVHEIQDGVVLTLNYSPEYFIQNIFIGADGSLNLLPEFTDLCYDSAFIDALVTTKNDRKIRTEFCKDDLGERETLTCLIAITHLIQRKHLNVMTKDCFEKVVEIVNNNGNLKDEHLRYALSILYKLLYVNGFVQFKQEIIQQVKISDLIEKIAMYPKNSMLHFCVIYLINTIVKCCKREKRKYQIAEMYDKKNREIIYTNIIEQKSNVEEELAHQLYIYQTYLLR